MVSAEPATVTLKLHWLALLQESVATHLTVVVPTGKTDPEGGVQTTVTGPGQSSVAVTLEFTTAPFGPAQPTVRSPGKGKGVTHSLGHFW